MRDDSIRRESFMLGWSKGTGAWPIPTARENDLDYIEGYNLGMFDRGSAMRIAENRLPENFCPARAGAEQTPPSR